jgi:hypothetical protein
MVRALAKWLRRLLILAIGLSVLYVGGLNLFLNSSYLLSQINKKPDKLWMHYGWAWCLWPSEVHLQDFRIRGADRRARWSIEAGRLRVRLNLKALLDRRVHAVEVRGEQCKAAIDWSQPAQAAGAAPRQMPADVSATAAAPPAPAATSPAAAATPSAAATPPAKRPWQVRLDDVRLDELHALQLRNMTLTGQMRLSGSLELRPRESLALGPTVLEALRAEARLPDHSAARGLRGMALGSIPRIRLGVPGSSVLEALDAHGWAEGRVEDLEFLDFYLQKSPWLRFRGGGGPVRTELRVEDGLLIRWLEL